MEAKKRYVLLLLSSSLCMELWVLDWGEEGEEGESESVAWELWGERGGGKWEGMDEYKVANFARRLNVSTQPILNQCKAVKSSCSPSHFPFALVLFVYYLFWF